MTEAQTSPDDSNGTAVAVRARRVVYYDVLNVAACFGVLALHFNGLAHAYSQTAAWYQAFSVECLFFWAVPVFFMLTGATLMRYRERYDTKTFFRRRLTRVLVPFLIWSAIALVWKVATGQMEPPMGPRTVINLVFNTQILDIYWFFIPLFSIYLAMPVLSLLARDENDRALWYGVVVAFVTTALLPCLFGFVGLEYNQSLDFPLFSGYLIYPVLGYLLAKTSLSRRTRVILYVLGVAGVALRYFGTIGLSAMTGELDQRLWGYLNFPGMLESVAVFVFAKQVRWERVFRTPGSRRHLAAVAGCSFGIYLTHMFLFWIALQVTGLNGGYLVWRTLGPVVAFVICLAFVSVVKKIPGLRVAFP